MSDEPKNPRSLIGRQPDPAAPADPAAPGSDLRIAERSVAKFSLALITVTEAVRVRREVKGGLTNLVTYLW